MVRRQRSILPEMKLHLRLPLLAATLACGLSLHAAAAKPAATASGAAPGSDRLEWWREARFGLAASVIGPYLIAAVGDFVNDDGVPSSWSLNFIDRAAADAVLVVEIDPWGKVTGTREVTGDEVTSFVSQYTNRIPYSIIDSAHAVGLGKAALASRYDLDKTKDPRIGLNYSSLDGSGPYWVYTIFYESNAEYVSAQVDALTGDVTSLH